MLAQRIVDSSPSLMAYLDPAGRLRFANPAFAGWFDRVPQPGETLQQAMGPAAAELEARLPAAAAGAPQEWTGMLTCPAGGARWISAALVPDRDRDGRIAGVILTVHDVGAAREAARAAPGVTDDADEMTEVFLAMLGHDLRNPLNTITVSSSHLLRHAALPEAHARALSRIATSAERMRRLIEQLLDFSRSRMGGGIPIVRTRCDLAAVCRQVVDEIQSVHPQRQVRLHASGDLAGEWDRDRLGEAISNLAANAVQHGREGTPVDIELAGDRDRVVLTVRNHGALPAQLLPLLFDPVRRRDAGEGQSLYAARLGLGLYITDQVVKAHGGRIDVAASPDEIRFRVELPRASAPAGRAPVESLPPVVPAR